MAQTAAMITWWTATRRARYIARRDPDAGVISQAVAWIDSSMAVASSSELRAQLIKAVNEVCLELSIHWKGGGKVNVDANEPVEFIGSLFDRVLEGLNEL